MSEDYLKKLHTQAFDTAVAAVATLMDLNYTYEQGAERWRPPLGPAPDVDKMDQLDAIHEAGLQKLQEVAETGSVVKPDTGLWHPDICIYHGNCDDGFGAAYVVWKMYGDSVEYVPMKYGDNAFAWSKVEDKHVLFVDFSLKAKDLKIVQELYPMKSCVILDHHKTALEELGEWNCGVIQADSHVGVSKALAHVKMPIIAFFDMESSGAAMAWQFFEPRQQLPHLLSIVQARDLWQLDVMPHVREVSAALRTYEHDFKVWDALMGQVPMLVETGKTVLQGHQKNVRNFCKEVYLHAFPETNGVIFQIPVVNVPYHYASDCADYLLKAHPYAPFVGAWFVRADGKRQWSLRSTNDRQDVSEVAKCFGGGGHRNAAGFEQTFTA